MTVRIRPLKPVALGDGFSVERLGFWSAIVATIVGIIYILGLGSLAVMGQFTMPPSQPAQLFGAIVTMTMAPLLVILLACVHQCAPEERKAWSLAGLAFAALFAAMVSINRYVQLTVIRQGLADGSVDRLQLFLPYGDNSIMFSLEILGWSFFLGLAALCTAAVFNGGGLEGWLRGLLIAYGLLGLTSALGLVLASPITAVGFVAWGPVLAVIAALLGVWFRRRARAPRSTSP